MRYSHRETDIQAQYFDSREVADKKKTGKDPKRSKYYHEAIALLIHQEPLLKKRDEEVARQAKILESLVEEVGLQRSENRTLHMMQEKTIKAQEELIKEQSKLIATLTEALKK